MAGTKEGGFAAARTNKEKYGPDFYAKIGAKGGKKGHTGGFADGEAGKERARIYGAMGGRNSRRGKSVRIDESGFQTSEMTRFSMSAVA